MRLRVFLTIAFFLCSFAFLSIARAETLPKAANSNSTQKNIYCNAARVAPGENHWACTAMCPERTKINSGGVVLSDKAASRIDASSQSGNGWHCDFGPIVGCNDAKPCPIRCVAWCKEAR